ncbi:MAG: FapA family protein [bacterium]|nr:FapA family protein [bacterium]
MATVKKEDLKPGMILDMDVIGTNNIILRKGVPLTERYIQILKNDSLFSIREVFITDTSYHQIADKSFDHREAGGITEEKEKNPLWDDPKFEKFEKNSYAYNGDLMDISDTINLPGSLVVRGSLINCPSVFIENKLAIFGDIKNCNINVKDEILIQGSIENTHKKFSINCQGSVTVFNSAKNCIINAEIIKINNFIVNCEVTADKYIEAPSSKDIENSKLQAGYNIILGSVAQQNVLIIFSPNQLKTIGKMFELEKQLKEYDKQIEPLKQTVQVFQILKDKLNQLNEEKKNKLITNVKLITEKVQKRNLLYQQFVTLKVETSKLKEKREKNPIVIEGLIEKGTKVMIDNSSFVVQLRAKGVIFYKKSFIIMAKKDKEWGKLI